LSLEKETFASATPLSKGLASSSCLAEYLLKSILDLLADFLHVFRRLCVSCIFQSLLRNDRCLLPQGIVFYKANTSDNKQLLMFPT
jgi:hypothetical protein